VIRILPLLLLFFVLFLIYRYYTTLPKEQRRPFLIKYLVYAVIAIVIAAVVTGRLHWIGAVAAAALGLLKIGASSIVRALPLFHFLRKNHVFGDPVFRTPYIELQIDLKHGSFKGRILQGEFAERELSSLNDDEFNKLEAQLKQHDRRAFYLVQVFRKKTHAKTEEYQSDGNLSNPSVNEARMMLGLPEKFTAKDVNLAYKRLMQKLHPDRGGNDYLASRINLARDILLKHLSEE
jgi:hypothetical protein